MLRRVRLLATCSVLSACSGSTHGSSFGPGGGPGGAAGATASGGANGAAGQTGAGGGAAVGGSGAGGAPETGGALGAGGEGALGGAASGGTQSGDAAASGGSTGSGDAGALGPTPGSVSCAGNPCALAQGTPYECCVGAPPFPTDCFPVFPGCVNAGIAIIACDDAADCTGGAVCCGNLNGQTLGSACAGGCQSPSHQLCRTDAECAAGHCLPLAAVPEYSECR